MFNTKRYATPQLLLEIPLYLQNILWFLIETMNVENQDYLQILELSETIIDGKLMQKILHKQENPVYLKEHTIPVKKAVNLKIFVIDDGTHSTMLLSDEY
jgi:hypothetical protein